MTKSDEVMDVRMGMKRDMKMDRMGQPESMDVKLKRAAKTRPVMTPKHPMTMSHNTSKVSTGKC